MASDDWVGYYDTQAGGDFRLGLRRIHPGHGPDTTIGRERTIGFMGEEARTYATPSMIVSVPNPNGPWYGP